MLSENDIPLYLNIDYIDELWVRRTRRGITQSEVQEASSKVAAKAKFGGLGKLWDLLLPEIGAEVSGEASRALKSTVEITSTLRALLLPELLPDVVDLQETDDLERDLSELSVGQHVRILCDNIDLTPLPTLAAYMRQTLLSGVRDEDLGESPDVFKAIEFATSTNRAMTFCGRTDDEYGGPALQRLMQSESDELHNAMALTNDDHCLAASLLRATSTDLVVYSSLNEKNLRRDVAAYAGQRPATYFGQVAYLRRDGRTTVMGVQPAAISLC
jgi:hypothetical protein